MFNYGDWVIYDPGFKREIGRFVCANATTAYICFHTDCTAQAVELKNIKLASCKQIANAPDGIGFHRFDDYCPNYDDEVCNYFCASKEVIRLIKEYWIYQQRQCIDPWCLYIKGGD